MTLAGAGMCLAGLPEAKAVTTTATQTETQNISLPQGLFANTALMNWAFPFLLTQSCLLYTSDAADDWLVV